MKRYTAGTIVPPGVYVRARPSHVSLVSREPGLLEGPRGLGYMRVPGIAIPLVAVLGLVLGGLYVVLFPIVGAAMLVACGANRVWRSLRQPVALHAADRSARNSGGGR
jgi:hypothetical protein